MICDNLHTIKNRIYYCAIFLIAIILIFNIYTYNIVNIIPFSHNTQENITQDKYKFNASCTYCVPSCTTGLSGYCINNDTLMNQICVYVAPAYGGKQYHITFMNNACLQKIYILHDDGSSNTSDTSSINCNGYNLLSIALIIQILVIILCYEIYVCYNKYKLYIPTYYIIKNSIMTRDVNSIEHDSARETTRFDLVLCFCSSIAFIYINFSGTALIYMNIMCSYAYDNIIKPDDCIFNVPKQFLWPLLLILNFININFIMKTYDTSCYFANMVISNIFISTGLFIWAVYPADEIYPIIMAIYLIHLGASCILYPFGRHMIFATRKIRFLNMDPATQDNEMIDISNNSQNNLNNSQNNLDNSQNNLNNLDSDKLCSICMENEKQYAFKCGHKCICSKCKPFVHKCPLCRTSSDLILIFE